MILPTSGGTVEIEEQPGVVTKRLHEYGWDIHGRVYREVQFLSAAHPLGIAPLLLDHGWDYVSMQHVPGLLLADAVRGASAAEVKRLAEAVVQAAFALHCIGLNHCDIHARNVVVRPGGSVCLLDGEWCRPIPANVPCAESFDISGRRHWEKTPIPAPASMYHGDIAWEPLKLLADMLHAETLAASGSSPLVPNPVCLYHSLNLPGLTVPGQRDTARRWNLYREAGVDPAGKLVLDLGCNVGGMAIEAARRGARWVVGVDITPERIRVATRLLRFGGLGGIFRAGDLRDPYFMASLLPADLVLLEAVSAYLNDAELDAVAGQAARLCHDAILYEANRDEDVAALWSRHGWTARQIGVRDDDAFEANRGRAVYLVRR